MSNRLPQYFWELADLFGDRVLLKNGQLSGKVRKGVDLAGMKVDFNLEICASKLYDEDGVMLCRGPGNLLVLIAAGLTAGPSIVAIIDASKMKEPEKTFADAQAGNVKEFLAMLSQHVNVAFRKAGRDGWKMDTSWLNQLSTSGPQQKAVL